MGLALGAGLVAALNPCGFAMLLAYLALVVRGEGTPQLVAVGRAVVATAAMVFGFLTVFGVFGALTIPVASTVEQYLPYITVLIGLVLVALGVWQLSDRHLTVLNPLARNSRWAPTARISSMFGYGVSYSIASLSCTVGPFLAVTAASLRGGTIVDGVLIYLAYAAGFSLLVGVLAIAAAFAGSAVVDRMHRILPYINRISGALVVLVGLYVGYYGVYEVRLFSANGNPNDPVIAVAGRLQTGLASQVHRLGAWPWLVALIVLVLAVCVLARRKAARGAADPVDRTEQYVDR